MSILEPISIYTTVNLTKGVIERMGWIKYVGFSIIFLTTHCRQESRPEGLLERDQMVDLMVEVYLAEAKISTTGIPKDSAVKLLNPFEESLMISHGINDSLLKANYSYYLQKPEELEKILDAVIDTLSLREQRSASKP